MRLLSGGCILAGDAGCRMSPTGLDPVADVKGFDANTGLIRCKGLRKGPVSIYIHVSQTPSLDFSIPAPASDHHSFLLSLLSP